MPKSKTRTTRRPADRPSAPPVSPEKALERATLALTQASLETVREAEEGILSAIRAGEDAGMAQEVHHLLRTASLALLIAYSRLAGLPDPRESPVVTRD